MASPRSASMMVARGGPVVVLRGCLALMAHEGRLSGVVALPKELGSQDVTCYHAWNRGCRPGVADAVASMALRGGSNGE